MLALSCTFIGLCLFIFGSFGNGLCILVFLRRNFRYRIITPFFIVLLIADSIYLLFRLMKVPYYLNTLFDLPRNSTSNSCSQTFLVRIFAYATQYWPQAFVPFIQPEIYLRFSLILMSIMSVQRTVFIKRSLKLQILPTTYTDKYKYKGTFLIIFLTFFLAYAFQFGGLTLFCSKSVSRDRSYDWFVYMNRRMNNVTHMLLNTIPKHSNDYQCVSYAVERLQKSQILFTEANRTCAKGDLMNILSFYFDQHDRSVVKLIQRIIFSKTGHNISRNDVYRKYHFHECLFPQEPNFFDRAFNFIYSRTFDFNRYTLILVFGSIVPSLITIMSNMISVYRVQELNRLTAGLIIQCRRRTDDTRRILIVITVECLFAIINSWFGQIILSFIYCKKKFLAGDDCPGFLSETYGLLITFDLLNSSSNIILHCLCGRRFRDELRRMILSWLAFFRCLFQHLWCCYFHISCTKVPDEQYVAYKVNTTRGESSNSSSHNQIFVNIQPASTNPCNTCCDCRWYCHRKPLTTSQHLSPNDQTNNETRYTPVTQQTYTARQTQPSSLRLYYASK
ncbi:unnamed protein product [Adineta ricciae]|uniref:G-protein coupled receptors family 1 profile domain-containing protein n=2 Tax=Adineta ricciae TaxID=249248 RepID=A0A813MUK7_ADIRI|nr:unnamed protein product [Adineta ricciae]CAF1302811.1 unnamed protein product [Adineta ricciae]